MTSKQFEDGMNSAAVVVFCFLFGMVFFTCGSCKILKHTESSKSDSTNVKKLNVNDTKVDSGGSVKKNETKAKEANEWERTIYHYSKDTNITKIYPTAVIYERGSGTKEQESNTTDSSWFYNFQNTILAAVDSLNNKIETAEWNKSSTTKGVGLITLILVAAGAVVLFKGLGYVGSKFQIVKKA